MIETWKSIPGYACYPVYQVSTLGRVKRLTVNGDRIIKPFKKHGYLYVGLCKNGKQTHYRLHRLVAEAFLPNPDNLPQINHKDEDKSNNRVNNLEWCDGAYNTNFGKRNRKISESNSKPVVALDKISGKEVYRFSSITEAAKAVYNARVSHISDCCKGNRKTSGGYKWRYVE